MLSDSHNLPSLSRMNFPSRKAQFSEESSSKATRSIATTMKQKKLFKDGRKKFYLLTCPQLLGFRKFSLRLMPDFDVVCNIITSLGKNLFTVRWWYGWRKAFTKALRLEKPFEFSKDSLHLFSQDLFHCFFRRVQAYKLIMRLGFFKDGRGEVLAAKVVR